MCSFPHAQYQNNEAEQYGQNFTSGGSFQRDLPQFRHRCVPSAKIIVTTSTTSPEQGIGVCLANQIKSLPFHPAVFIASRYSFLIFIIVLFSSTFLTIVPFNLLYHFLALSETERIKLVTQAVITISLAISIAINPRDQRRYSGIPKVSSHLCKISRLSSLISSRTLLHGTKVLTI